MSLHIAERRVVAPLIRVAHNKATQYPNCRHVQEGVVIADKAGKIIIITNRVLSSITGNHLCFQKCRIGEIRYCPAEHATLAALRIAKQRKHNLEEALLCRVVDFDGNVMEPQFCCENCKEAILKSKVNIVLWNGKECIIKNFQDSEIFSRLKREAERIIFF